MVSSARASAVPSPRSPLQEATASHSAAQEPGAEAKRYSLRIKIPQFVRDQVLLTQASSASPKPSRRPTDATAAAQAVPPPPPKPVRGLLPGASLGADVQLAYAQANTAGVASTQTQLMLQTCRQKYARVPAMLLHLLAHKDDPEELTQTLQMADRDSRSLDTLVELGRITAAQRPQTYHLSQTLEPFGTDLCMIALRLRRTMCAEALLQHALQEVLTLEDAHTSRDRLRTELVAFAQRIITRLIHDDTIHSIPFIEPKFIDYLRDKCVSEETGKLLAVVVLRFVYQATLAHCLNHFEQGWLCRPERLGGIMNECIALLVYPTHNEHYYMLLPSPL